MSAATTAKDQQLRGLIQQTERTIAAGQIAEARRMLASLEAAYPGHPLVLNVMGGLEMHSGNVAAARELIERATRADPRNPSLWINLASIHARAGATDAELAALEHALAIEPRHLAALLNKANALDRSGRTRAAATVYRNALKTIPPGTELPASMREAIEHATRAVAQNDSELERFLETRLGSVREQHPDADPSRFDHCIDALLGKRHIFTPEPTFLHFPKLPALEFYPRETFPWLDEFEAATAQIREEFERVFAQDSDSLEPYVAYPEGVPLDQWAKLNHSRAWSVFYLWREGHALPSHLERCPLTAQLLSKAPMVDVADHGPTAFFSILDAKAHIPAHTGVTNTRLTVHLPLVIPDGCRFRVGSDTREWRLNEAWIFDDTIEHEAWNDSAVPRAVLIFDVWNPFLSPAERDLVRAAVEGVRSFYKTGQTEG
ncbi:MAG TPA: aspartyl/asparaginyl beta-hydroxylase domain-containing protein [Povalibacter sp.]